jgi:hypothetical protein
MSDLNIRNALIQGVVTGAAGYVVVWPNMSTPKAANINWIRATILNIDDAPRSLGTAGSNEQQGSLSLSVFVPKTQGDLPAYTAINQLKQIFKTGARLESGGQSVLIRSASVANGATEQNWFSKILNVNFYTQTTRA